MRRLPFQLAAFLGAFLLFLVEPVIAKQILPWFGGTPAVWTTCLVFFQVGLVAGYSYPHLTARLSPRHQVTLHIGLLIAVAATLPITASAVWKPTAGSSPTLLVMEVLAVTVGAPYVVLAATTPLVQGWYGRVAPGRSPYWLYALSNAGSLLALLSYPAVFERWMTGRTIALVWSAGFVVFAAISCWCGWRVVRLGRGADVAADPDIAVEDVGSRIRVGDRLLWIFLPACGSALLLAATNQLCQDIAVVPLLWIVPLALYLVTYILSFAHWYSRPLWAGLFVVAAGATVFILGHAETTPVVAQASAVLAVLVAGCMLCHGELVRLAPPARRATAFYLAIAAGGSVGGIFVGVIAPQVFTSYLEFPLLLIAVFAVVVIVTVRDAMSRRHVPGLAIVSSVPVLVTVIAFSLTLRTRAAEGVVATTRNFYGVLTVVDTPRASGGMLRQLMNGRVLHGSQVLDGSATARATTYYAPGSGIAVAVEHHPRRLAGQSLQVGVIGLGAGTIAAWGRAGDAFRFFEINPADADFAGRYFTFLKESAAATDVVLGDGRLSLEREVAVADRQRRYDVLAVDAFSGDSIPVHLLTGEAFDVYLRAMAPDGVLAIHVSNLMIDLEPVVRALAEERGLEAIRIVRQPDAAIGASESVWMLVTTNHVFADDVRSLASPSPSLRRIVAWADDFSSVLSVIR